MVEESLCNHKNVGPIDRTVRIILGLSLIIVPAFYQWSPWTIAILAAFGGSQIVEGITAY